MISAKDFRPAHYFANQYGVKALCYGPPGAGKTPVLNGAPRPLLLAIEPGLGSMRGSTVPTFMAETAAKIDDFMVWLKTSVEAKNYDTVCVDSVAQMMTVYIREDEFKHPAKHGLQVYGEAATRVMDHMYSLYYMQNKHVYVTTKQTPPSADDPTARPYFPGKQLNVDIPHLFDGVLHLAWRDIPGAGNVQAFRTKSSFEAIARDRSGRLNELEPADLGALIKKCMT